MSQFLPEDRQPTKDLDTVESQRNDLFLEEFPEGPYGASVTTRSEVDESRNEEWRSDQDTHIGYENTELHKDIPRGYPGEDPLKDTNTPMEKE